MRKLFALAMLCGCIWGQDQDPAYSISGGPPPKVWSVLYFYTNIGGSDYIEYSCYARSTQPSLTNRVSSSSPIYAVTQIVAAASDATVTTSSAHGFSIGNRVTVANVSGGGTGLNGPFIVASVPSTTTFTYAVVVTPGTYNNQGITITSTAPRTNAPIWAIKRYYYGGTGGTSLLGSRWAMATGATTSATTSVNSCDGRAALPYQ